MIRKYAIHLIVTLVVVFGITYYFTSNRGNDVSGTPTESPLVFISPSPSPFVSPRISRSSSPKPSTTPLPSPTKQPGLVGDPVPWYQLPPQGSCELKGEIKYVLVNDGPNHNNVYDNQDAKFIYKGIDHPGRLIYWTVSPQDNLGVGPQIFAQMPLPDGESLIGISLPENPKYKRYELTASIDYGRLVDGNVKVFTKACIGKTIVILP